jgi:hypothetical protein
VSSNDAGGGEIRVEMRRQEGWGGGEGGRGGGGGGGGPRGGRVGGRGGVRGSFLISAIRVHRSLHPLPTTSSPPHLPSFCTGPGHRRMYNTPKRWSAQRGPRCILVWPCIPPPSSPLAGKGSLAARAARGQRGRSPGQRARKGRPRGGVRGDVVRGTEQSKTLARFGALDFGLWTRAGL